MSISTILNVSALGIHRNIERLNAAAAKVAEPDNVGDVQPTVEMIVAQHGAQANLNAFKCAARMNRAMLDILA